MQVVRKRLLAATLAPALILGLVISELPLTGEQHSALAAVNLGCKGSLTISPSTSGTFSSPGRPNVVTLSATGLDSNNKQVFLVIYDSSGRSASLIPLANISISATGTYNGQAQLPAAGVAGGPDQIVVADFGPSCAAAPYTINPLVSVFPSQGTYFNFNGYGFSAGSPISITFTDHAGAPFTLPGATSGSQGTAGGLNIAIPANAAIGAGTLVFKDSQGGQTPGIPFTFSGVPPTATPCPSCPTNTPFPTSTFVPVGSVTITPTPTGTRVGFPTSTNTPLGGATNTPIPFPTNTWTPITGKTPTRTPVPGGIASATFTSTPNTGFPSPTWTPNRSFPSPTPSSTPVGTRCRRRGALVDGDFSNGLVCWNTNQSSAVAVQPLSNNTKVKAARVTAKSDMVVLSQAFAATSSTHSVTFYFQNLAKPALAQLSANGRVLVGRRLTPTKAGSFAYGTLPIPGSASGADITVAFTAQKGSLIVHDVAVSQWPSGVAPKPAPKPKTTAKPKPTAKH